MKLIVEETEIELDLPRENVKLCDVANEMEEFLFTVGKVPCGLSINGCQLEQEDYERRENEILQGDEVFHFEVMSVLRFLNENLEGAAEANRLLIVSIGAFCKGIQEGGNEDVGPKLLDELQQFFQFWLKLSQLLPELIERVDFGGRKIFQVLEEIRSLLQEIVTAMEEGDFVLATDLFQYEVTPILEGVARGVPVLKEEIEKLEVREEADAKP
jgi:hypothetical protein